jgi:hypothetical protein
MKIILKNPFVTKKYSAKEIVLSHQNNLRPSGKTEQKLSSKSAFITKKLVKKWQKNKSQ